MTPTRDLDFTPLTRRTGLGTRLTSAGADNLTVMGAVVGTLLVVVPTAVLVGLLATGNATDIGGLALLAMCIGGGGYVLLDILRGSRGSVALENFARENDLVLTRGLMVRHYRGSLFADGSSLVRQSVRTSEERFVEVGERFHPRVSRNAFQPNRPQLFLRARLAGPATHDLRSVVTPALHDVLEGFAGDYTLEVADDELTLFGSHPLHAERPGRVEEAFAHVDELAARVNAQLVPASQEGAPAASPASIPSGVTDADLMRPGAPQVRRRRPLVIVGWTLALLIAVPLGIAVIMSGLDDQLRGNRTAAGLTVSLVVLAAGAVAARVAKAAATARRTDQGRSS